MKAQVHACAPDCVPGMTRKDHQDFQRQVQTLQALLEKARNDAQRSKDEAKSLHARMAHAEDKV